MSTARTPAQRLRALAAEDFYHDNPASVGEEELRSVCEELQGHGTVVDCAGDMFDLMERLDDVDLGSPGPLVHALESTAPDYEPSLVASVQRKPSPLSVWMVNRILNTNRHDRDRWLELLRLAFGHPLSSDQTRRDAEDFLALQTHPGST